MRWRDEEKCPAASGSGTSLPCSAANLKPRAAWGLKEKTSGALSDFTMSVGGAARKSLPANTADDPLAVLSTTCSFVDSVMYLLRMSLASSREMSDAIIGEGMFETFVPLCGVIEAKY